MRKALLVLLSGLFSAALLSGCNTVAGVGKDMKAAGQGVENAANQAK